MNAPFSLANSGEVLWWGQWNDPDSQVNRGLFVEETLLVQDGVTTAAGSLIESVYFNPHSFALSPNGRWIVFSARLDDGRRGAFLIDRGIRATAAMRNGAGGNDILLASTSPPVLGGHWTAEVDNSGHDGALTLVHGFGAGADGIHLVWGELLVDPLSPPLFLSHPVGGTTTHVQAVPSDISFLGGVVSAQAVVLSSPPVLTNAIDLVLGH